MIIITAGTIIAPTSGVTTITAIIIAPIMAGIAITAGGMGRITTAGTNSRIFRMPDDKDRLKSGASRRLL
ncbi:MULTISPECIES: hypothetical protein [unclassified Rhizobium]|uniref:hypothetical protein n=1 Tax=unclassified Rhizobium TaxID=2613769 RepID=UPI0018ED1626